MATVSSSQRSSRAGSPDIIDVDALEDEPIVHTGFHGPPISRPDSGPSAGASSSSQNVQDDEIMFTGYRRRSPRRASRTAASAHAGPSVSSSRNNVIVVDSDEDVPLSNTSRHSQRDRSRLLSPPPPPAQRGHTPGVPQLPSHLASQSSLPRRHRSSDVPPPIRPLSHPLPFEATLAAGRPRVARPRNHPPAPEPAPAPAPRSHHQPSMGLGGAMIALNRQNAIEEANRANRERDRPSRGFNLPTFTDILRRMTGFGETGNGGARPEGNEGGWRHRLWPFSWDHPMLEADNDFVSPFENDDAWFGPPDRPDRLRFGFDSSRYGPAPEKIALWRREYTHPWKLTPGFTYDFAPSEDPTITSGNTSPPIYLDEDGAGPSSSASTSSSATAVETTLVCARCLEPLVLAPSNDTSYQSEEMKMRRVWALRCGHMLDGKCVAELMVPPNAPAKSVSMEPTEEQLIANAKGKGKAREGADIDMPPAVVGEGDVPLAEETAIPDRKGKRKAVEPHESQVPPKRPALASAAEPEPNSIRSRLRSHGRIGADESPSSSGAPGGPAHVTAAENDSYSPSTRRGRKQPGTSPALTAQAQSQARYRTRGKGKGKAKVEQKPPIEAEHEWKCPVVGCGCVHYSVRVDGVWKTDQTRGPIALFV